MPTLYRRESLTFFAVACATLFVTTNASVFAREPSVRIAAPEMPSAPRPADAATEQSITASLSWTGGGAVAYDIYFGTEADPPLVASSVANPAYQVSAMEFETTYHWRVVARDELGIETSGPVWSFLTRFNSPPILPFDPTPPNQGLTSTAVVLGWRSGDPDLQPVTYRLLFGTTNPPPQIAIGLTARTYTLPPLQVNTTYYWRVVASDGTFNVTSPTWRFYVFTVPVLISRFDAVEGDRGVDVMWELSSDEAIAQTTLYRRSTSETLPVPIATVDARARSYRDDTVAAGQTYHYELVVQTAGDDVYRSPIATVTTRARALALMQNHPNPFNPRTTISYDLPSGDSSEHVRLVVLDVAGRVVRTLVDGNQPGRHAPRGLGREGRPRRCGLERGLHLHARRRRRASDGEDGAVEIVGQLWGRSRNRTHWPVPGRLKANVRVTDYAACGFISARASSFLVVPS